MQVTCDLPISKVFLDQSLFHLFASCRSTRHFPIQVAAHQLHFRDVHISKTCNKYRCHIACMVQDYVVIQNTFHE